MTPDVENPGALAGAAGVDIKAVHDKNTSTFRFWRQDRRWRLLPYVKARWSGPFGETYYLADRNYSVIAFRADSERWLRGRGESLARCWMDQPSSIFTWRPGEGDSPQVSDATLADLLRRCAAHPATAWILAGRGAQ